MFSAGRDLSPVPSSSEATLSIIQRLADEVCWRMVAQGQGGDTAALTFAQLGAGARGDPGHPALLCRQSSSCWELCSCSLPSRDQQEVPRAGSSRCKAPIEAPLIFQGFSGFGLYKMRQEEERGEGDSRQKSLSPAALSSSNNSVKTER